MDLDTAPETTFDNVTWTVGPTRPQWLIVEHSDGSLEDLGIVSTRVLIPLVVMNDDLAPDDAFRHRFEWWTDGRSQVTLVEPTGGKDDYSLRRPLPSGSGEIWHVGPAAHAKALTSGLLARSA